MDFNTPMDLHDFKKYLIANPISHITTTTSNMACQDGEVGDYFIIKLTLPRRKHIEGYSRKYPSTSVRTFRFPCDNSQPLTTSGLILEIARITSVPIPDISISFNFSEDFSPKDRENCLKDDFVWNDVENRVIDMTVTYSERLMKDQQRAKILTKRDKLKEKMERLQKIMDKDVFFAN